MRRWRGVIRVVGEGKGVWCMEFEEGEGKLTRVVFYELYLAKFGLREWDEVVVFDYAEPGAIYMGNLNKHFDPGLVSFFGEGDRWLALACMREPDPEELLPDLPDIDVDYEAWQRTMQRQEAFRRVHGHREAYQAARYGMSVDEMRLRNFLGVQDTLGFGDALRGLLTGYEYKPMDEKEASAHAKQFYDQAEQRGMLRQEGDTMFWWMARGPVPGTYPVISTPAQSLE